MWKMKAMAVVSMSTGIRFCRLSMYLGPIAQQFTTVGGCLHSRPSSRFNMEFSRIAMLDWTEVSCTSNLVDLRLQISPPAATRQSKEEGSYSWKVRRRQIF
eukprot:PhF_6_TR39702/c1_g1_i1/m.59038